METVALKQKESETPIECTLITISHSLFWYNFLLYALTHFKLSRNMHNKEYIKQAHPQNF